jgi:uncharacterized protein (DUF488 family)
MSTLIYSLGHGNRSWEELLALLRWADVRVLVDVRRWPRSKRHPHFSRDALEAAARAEGVVYRDLGPSLGGFRPEGYEAYTKSEAFKLGLDGLVALADEQNTAFMCAERLPERCHRRFIARELVRRGLEMRHLLEPGEYWEPSQPSLFDEPG